ncbi:flagellar assembly protein FliH [Rhizobacter sp. SG703]|uniref:FliH/SctL family protein n=1 Tax=Rhizobacter sp. SG703 TaxID=2587140 RepID=UPI001446000C|nr:flagellar assembly protein FliH [Rhizobacter sp. SG703]NKI93111.1 flagellar assembly protein FliH [Rhizobacter sp. SG703]
MTSSSKPTGPRQVPPPAGSKPANSYSRFIPREELNSFAAWTPGSLSGGNEAPNPGVHRPEPPAPPAPNPVDELMAQLKQVRQTGYQDGYRDGLVALDGFKQSYAAQVTAQVGALVQGFGQQLDDLQQDMARALAVTATQLAKQMVRSELSVRPELVAVVATEAIDTLLLSARHITVRVHPDDHALVAQGAADVLAARGARLLSDAEVLRGGCLVESDIGVIDATLEARWRRVAASLGCEQEWEGDEAPLPEIDENGEPA